MFVRRASAVAVALLLAGCTVHPMARPAPTAPAPAPVPTVTVTAPAPVVEAAPARDTQAFLNALHYSVPASVGVDDQLSIDTGDAICEALRAGSSATEVMLMGTRTGLDSDVVAGLVAAAVLYLCPDQRAAVEAQL